jgi:hypothetical protein
MPGATPDPNRGRYRLRDPSKNVPQQTIFHAVSHHQFRVPPTKFTKVDFVDCSFANTDFYGSEFSHVTFVGCDLITVHMGPIYCSDLSFVDCFVDGLELYASYLDNVHASPEFWDQVNLSGAYLSRGSAVPPGYKTRPATLHDLAENRKPRWIDTTKSRIIRDGLQAPAPKDSHRGYLIYEVLEYDLDALGPHAEFLLKEHPRLPTGKLKALASALMLA